MDESVSFEPLHYLALLERKPGALDHARPLQGWTTCSKPTTINQRLKLSSPLEQFVRSGQRP